MRVLSSYNGVVDERKYMPGQHYSHQNFVSWTPYLYADKQQHAPQQFSAIDQ